MMHDKEQRNNSENSRRLERAYKTEKSKFMYRLRAAGRTLEEAERTEAETSSAAIYSGGTK